MKNNLKKEKLRTLNNFRTKYPIYSDRSYFLWEEKTCKQFVEFFIDFLIDSSQTKLSLTIKNELLNIRNSFEKENEFVLSIKFKKLIDLIRADIFSKGMNDYTSNLLVALSSLEEISDHYKMFPKPKTKK